MSNAEQIHILPSCYSETHTWNQFLYGYKPVFRSNENPIVHLLGFTKIRLSAIVHFSRSVFFCGLDFSTFHLVLNTWQWSDPYNLHPANCTLPLSPLFACSIQVRSSLSFMLGSFAPFFYFHEPFTLFWEGKRPLGFYVFQLNTLQRQKGVDREGRGLQSEERLPRWPSPSFPWGKQSR